jgi:hypothetical protein
VRFAYWNGGKASWNLRVRRMLFWPGRKKTRSGECRIYQGKGCAQEMRGKECREAPHYDEKHRVRAVREY